MSEVWDRHPGWGVADRPDDGEHGGRVYVAPLDSGVIHVLEGPSALVLRAALQGLGLDGIHRSVARELSVGVEEVDLEVVGELLDDLVALGVLTRG